jgi:hypothetical protein
MKGYFSELARQTGLRIGSGDPTTTGPPSPAAAAQRNSHSEIAGLDVEEVTFTSPSQPPPTDGTPKVPEPAGVETISTRAVGNSLDGSEPERLERPGADRDGASESDSTPIHFSTDATVEVTAGNPTVPELRAQEEKPRSAQMETDVIEYPRVVISAKTSLSAQTPDSSQIPESVSTLEERQATAEPTLNDSDQSPRRRRLTVEPDSVERIAGAEKQGGAGVEERIERQLLVRNYLKEISEWISTPASSPEEEPVSFISADRVESAADQAHRPPRSHVALPDQSRMDLPEQQDLSLSIGTIKIVIEEPRKDVPAPPAPAAKPEPAFERTTTAAPTDLSRYYLNRW